MSVVHRFGLGEHQNNSFHCSRVDVRSGEDVRSMSLRLTENLLFLPAGSPDVWHSQWAQMHLQLI
jgi:hypothetical protein